MRMTRHGWHGGMGCFLVECEKVDAVLVFAVGADQLAGDSLAAAGLIDRLCLAAQHHVEAVRRAVAKDAAGHQEFFNFVHAVACDWLKRFCSAAMRSSCSAL